MPLMRRLCGGKPDHTGQWSRWNARHAGNALMEYAVPTCIILFSAGLWGTWMNQNKSLALYFVNASGYTESSLSDTTFKVSGMGQGLPKDAGNGMNGFPGFSFAVLVDGNGNRVAGTTLGGVIYPTQYKRSGSRQTPPNNEALYPDTPPV